MNKKLLGYTLIEMIIVVGVLAVIMTVISSSLAVIITNKAKSLIMGEVRNNGSYALDFLAQKIRSSQSAPNCIDPATISVSDSNGDIILACVDYNGSGFNRLTAGYNFDPLVNPPLTNRKVQVRDCSGVFSCQTFSSGLSAVTVNFSLVGRVDSSSKGNKGASQTFSTTVYVRSY